VTAATWLTLLRMVLIVPFGAALMLGAPIWAAVIFLIAGLTDWLDGFVARKRGEMTALGATLDPVADKMLTAAALILFAAIGTITGWHLIAAVAIALREALVGGLREAAGARGIKLPVTFLAKIKTSAQFTAFLVLCFGPTPLGLFLLWVAAALTVVTGAEYTVKAVRALSSYSDAV
jgi:cardiolipin synthase